MTQRVPFMLVPESLCRKVPIKPIMRKLSGAFPSVTNDLYKSDVDQPADEFFRSSFINAIFMGLLFTFLIYMLLLTQNMGETEALSKSALSGLGTFLIFVILYLKYPGILAKKKAENVDKDLLFALKDISLQINAGVTLYTSFNSVAKGNYKETSAEFKKVIEDVDSGKPMVDTLTILAERSESNYLRRTFWQIINSINSGSNLREALKKIIKDLTVDQRSKIENYAKELNLWSLIYMLFAVAIPSIGSTMLVILSSFAGLGMSRGMFISFIITCFIIQIGLIIFVKSRRPVSNI